MLSVKTSPCIELISKNQLTFHKRFVCGISCVGADSRLVMAEARVAAVTKVTAVFSVGTRWTFCTNSHRQPHGKQEDLFIISKPALDS